MTSESAPRTVLVDSDIITYRYAFACQKTHYQHKETGEFFDGKMKAKTWLKENYPDWDFNEDEWDIQEEIEPWKNCKYLVDKGMEEIVANTKSDEYRCFLSPSKCFRHSVATVRPYKDRRPPPPFYKDKVRDYLIKQYGAEVGDNIEADDMLGMSQDTNSVIASIDKDLLMIPGKHYDIVKKTKTTIDLLEADSMFFTQLLAGDSVDNIQGIPGIGMKKAVKIIDEFYGDHVGLVEYIKDIYEEHYPTEGDSIMREMASLVWILRKGDTFGAEQWRKLLILDE